MTLPLLQTKLYAPPPRPQQVPRTHLLARLYDREQRLLTLISAPAGFGKTTLVSAWCAQIACPVAWLALDEEDNDPTRFLLYLITALQSQQPALGGSALTLLAAPQPPPAKTILTLLLNELTTQAAPLVLILDDYHWITTPAIHDAVAFLVEHLPPAFHLVITTRIDPPLPLARWRVRHQLTEIRADDLRFTPAEAAHFLNQVMGLALTESQIATLETRTEGWIAGLQLAALSLQGRTDVAGFIQAFSGSNRHVVSYLLEEVLNRRPEGTLDFLLQTAILDRLSAPLCNAVTGRRDSQALLAKLEASNLFLIPLDDEGQWYRYHHLFAEALRTRLHQLQAPLVPELYRRASAWCEQNDQMPEAIQHALASQDYTHAAQLIEQVNLTLSPNPTLQALLNQWVARVPDLVIAAHPRLCVIHALLLYRQTEVARALQRIQQADLALQQAPYADPARTRRVRQEILAVRALLAAYAPQPDYAQAIADGQEVLATTEPSQAGLRQMAMGAIASAYIRHGQMPQALAMFQQAVQVGQAANDMYVVGAAGVNLVMGQRVAGLLRAAITTCQQLIEWVLVQAKAAHLVVGPLYSMLADLLRETNELTRAAQVASEGVALCDRWANPFHALISRFVLLRIKQAQGDWASVATLWDEVTHWAANSRFGPSSFLPFAQAQLLLAQGKWIETVPWFQAVNWQEAMPTTIFTGQEFIYFYEYQRVAPAQVALAQVRATKDRAQFDVLRDHLVRQQQAAAREGLLWLRIKAHCLQALAHAALGETQAAFKALAHALTLAEPEGFVRVFVDEGEELRFLIYELRITLDDPQLAIYADKLLSAFGFVQQPLIRQESQFVNRKSKIVNLIEPLSDREQEVLQLVALGLSNTQVADRLIVTTGTVKTHLNRIFGKLAVQSRTQAIARGRELGLLPD